MGQQEAHRATNLRLKPERTYLWGGPLGSRALIRKPSGRVLGTGQPSNCLLCLERNPISSGAGIIKIVTPQFFSSSTLPRSGFANKAHQSTWENPSAEHPLCCEASGLGTLVRLCSSLYMQNASSPQLSRPASGRLRLSQPWQEVRSHNSDCSQLCLLSTFFEPILPYHFRPSPSN